MCRQGGEKQGTEKKNQETQSRCVHRQDSKCKRDPPEGLAKISSRVEAPRVRSRGSFTKGKNTVAAEADLWQPSADTAHLPVNPVAPRMTRSYLRSLPPKIPLTGDCPPLLARFLGEIALRTLDRVSIVEDVAKISKQKPRKTPRFQFSGFFAFNFRSILLNTEHVNIS
jgi:hypothetical protein